MCNMRRATMLAAAYVLADEGLSQTDHIAAVFGCSVAQVAPTLRALQRAGLIRQTNYELPSGCWAWELY